MAQTICEQENVNGVKLKLIVDKILNSRQYTISFTKNENKTHLFTAVVFCIIAIIFRRISLTMLVVIIVVFLVLVTYWIVYSVYSECLLVMPTGVQHSVQYFFHRDYNFVPWTSINDIIINEVITMSRVLYYLTILVKENNSKETTKLIPLFKYTIPRLAMLQEIYSEIQNNFVDAQNDVAMGSGDTT